MMKISVPLFLCAVLASASVGTTNAVAAGHATCPRRPHQRSRRRQWRQCRGFPRTQWRRQRPTAAPMRPMARATPWPAAPQQCVDRMAARLSPVADPVRNADGSAAHQSSSHGQSAAGGSYATSGISQRNADGTRSGSRITTANGANGGSYAGSTGRRDAARASPTPAPPPARTATATRAPRR